MKVLIGWGQLPRPYSQYTGAQSISEPGTGLKAVNKQSNKTPWSSKADVSVRGRRRQQREISKTSYFYHLLEGAECYGKKHQKQKGSEWEGVKVDVVLFIFLSILSI